MKLVIVESPAKSKTIGHYLGDDYKVVASVGHIRDLATTGKGGFGVDIENGFKARYVINPDKKKVIKELESLKKKADEVILATDPDREGEAIAFGLAEVLNLPIESTKRLEFHEITKNTILESLDKPRYINKDLVNSQEARRIIDRILGFMLSGLLKNKIGSQSAGRVQSVALKLICEHEEEILNFKKEKFYKLLASIIKDEKEFPLTLVSYKGKKLENFKEESMIDEVLTSCSNNVTVTKIDEKAKSISSKEPYRTSTLQQSAFTYLGFSTRETTYLAQELYEGVETDEGMVGLITYIRTDSTRMSPSFIEKAKTYILDKYGPEFYKGPHALMKVENQQDAHECIRPTSIARTPEKMKKYLSLKAYKLYKLIYDRSLASLMSDKKVLTTTVEFTNNDLVLKLVGTRTIFKGFDSFNYEENDKEIPVFNLNETYLLKTFDKEEDETKPPNRYNEGKIVKMMEEKGIGRPSTYSSTIQTLIQRKYVTSTKGVLTPTEQGMLTTKVLRKYFSEIVNEEYTANMEISLDKIQNGSISEIEVISNFYYPFLDLYNDVKEKMYKEPLKPTGEKCPMCGSDLVERHGRYGKFVACSNYPNCKYVKKDEEVREVGRNCPECGKPLIYRKNKKGSEFIGCSGFPKCHYIESIEPTNEKPLEDRFCPNCGAKLVLKYSRGKSFYACPNYPKCKHTEGIK